ncbi:pilus assembly protein [Thermobifida halotolerans]|uniref:Pilus assembly protein n=1 Tax=Thermobifida halotolerans TaxID=483545 RepID=A0AA97M248_9ACTN|nr:pilus assembly protein [Thermobifida halotolerans]
MALPCLVLVLSVALACVHAAGSHLECVDAARIGARALARGEDEAAVRSLASGAGPPGSVVELSSEAGFVHVSVTATVRIVPGTPPVLRVGGSAAAPAEPDR